MPDHICTACEHPQACRDAGGCKYGWDIDREPSYPQRSLVPEWIWTLHDLAFALGGVALIASIAFFPDWFPH